MGSRMRLTLELRRRILLMADAGVPATQIVVRARASIRHVSRSYPPMSRLRIATALELAIISTLLIRRPARFTAAICLVAVMIAGISATLSDSGTVTSEPALKTPTTLTMKPSGLLAWQRYKDRFIAPSGRVVDTGNENVSHSEGQGYAMVLAVAADDNLAFERIWEWTRQHLMVRSDGLLSWRWSPVSTPPVTDPNNASDGDILVAWALAEAGSRWAKHDYTSASRTLAMSIGKRLLFVKQGQLLLNPGATGFSVNERPDGHVVNLSYWVFPALLRLSDVAPEVPWSKLSATGLHLLSQAAFGPQKLPPDWLAFTPDGHKPAQGFATVFGNDSIRIPLYLIWAGQKDHILIKRLFSLWNQPQTFATIEIFTGTPLWRFGDPGYAAIKRLVEAAISTACPPAAVDETSAGKDYYPATLALLALVASEALRLQRHNHCSTDNHVIGKQEMFHYAATA
jgi:endoglucanase